MFSDEEVFKTIKPKSREAYVKCWDTFKNHFGDKKDEFNLRMPSEKEFCVYFRYLREDQKRASSSLWTIYSMINAMVKGKYGKALQGYPRLIALVKGWTVKVTRNWTVKVTRGWTVKVTRNWTVKVTRGGSF